jgi:hypothetical protein
LKDAGMTVDKEKKLSRLSGRERTRGKDSKLSGKQKGRWEGRQGESLREVEREVKEDSEEWMLGEKEVGRVKMQLWA